MKYLLLFLTAASLASCSNSPFGFKKISEFHVDTAALANHAKVEVLYTSGAPDFNKDETYYIQYLVRKQGGHDTVRLLCPSLTKVDKEHHEFDFISAASKDKVDMLLIRSAYMSSHTSEDPNKIADMPMKEIDKVVTNNKFSDIENHNYPTVIGALATVTDTAGMKEIR